MNPPTVVRHQHAPVFRVLRAGHSDPLDGTQSRRRPGRWNTADYPALYCCCSELTAKAVAQDRFNLAAVDLADLQPEAFPQLFELDWAGSVVDVASSVGIAAAGFSPSYPEGVSHEETKPRAAQWHQDGLEGVVCRSASLSRLGFSGWSDDCQLWGELAVFTERAQLRPALRRERSDLDWLR